MKQSFKSWCIENNKNYLLKEWDYYKNRDIKIDDITYGSGKSVWWICSKNSKHSYQTRVVDRKNGHGCPICAGKQILQGDNDLESNNPDVANEWDYSKNGNTKPSDVFYHSAQKYWWKCNKCGYVWSATVDSRTTMKSGCPQSSRINRVKTKNKNQTDSGNNFKNWCSNMGEIGKSLLDDWDKDMNTLNGITEDNIQPGSSKYIYWKCHKCSHKWKTKLRTRTLQGNGCPNCSKYIHSSLPEKTIVYYLKKISTSTIQENFHAKWLGRYEIDIYIKEFNIAIEYDGKAWHKNKVKDQKKDNILNNHGCKVIRMREEGCPNLQDGISICIPIYGRQTYDLNNLQQPIEKLLKIISKFTHKEYINIINVKNDFYDICKEYYKYEKEHSLLTLYPLIAKEWDMEQNRGLSPKFVNAMSNKKAYWKCKTCGGSWQAQISNRTSKGHKCPYCTNHKVLPGYNDLKTKFPDIASEWNYSKNGVLKPDEILPGSNKDIWWKCKTCGHEWHAKPTNRTGLKTKCPRCAKHIKKQKYQPSEFLK